jgi:hypothetical protein
MTVPFSGGCQCGAVRYEVSAEPIAVYLCHCRACQYESAGGPSVVVMVPRAAFKLSGTPKSHTVTADSGKPSTRNFCGKCGTPLFGAPATGGDIVMVRAGSMDDPSWLKPDATIWVSAAQPWAPIAEGLPTFEGNPTI